MRCLTVADAIAPDDRRLAPLQRVADRRAVHVVAGAPLASARGLHIGALCLAPDGTATTYAKRHLHDGEEVAFVPGDGGALLEVDGTAVAVAVCADTAHPEHAADAARLARYARAHRLAVMLANYGALVGGWDAAGRSAVWSRTGRLLACAPASGEAVVVAPLHG
jgi:predicted amidohydrolase